MDRVICPYCGRPAKRVTGKEVYPHRNDLYRKKFWICRPCDAYVGCHRDGKPFGTLANSDLRNIRMKVHEKFDRLWKSGRMDRNAAYKSLAKKLGISTKKCHIGMFDIEQCKRALRAAKEISREIHQEKQPSSFSVTDPDLDAPDGAIVDGYERHGSTWERINDNENPD